MDGYSFSTAKITVLGRLGLGLRQLWWTYISSLRTPTRSVNETQDIDMMPLYDALSGVAFVPSVRNQQFEDRWLANLWSRHCFEILYRFKFTHHEYKTSKMDLMKIVAPVSHCCPWNGWLINTIGKQKEPISKSTRLSLNWMHQCIDFVQSLCSAVLIKKVFLWVLKLLPMSSIGARAPVHF